MNVPGLPMLPAPSPDMVDNWRHTGNHLDKNWRYRDLNSKSRYDDDDDDFYRPGFLNTYRCNSWDDLR